MNHRQRRHHDAYRRDGSGREQDEFERMTLHQPVEGKARQHAGEAIDRDGERDEKGGKAVLCQVERQEAHVERLDVHDEECGGQPELHRA
ncbi:hypothetical protein D3C87_1554920 [compost metagenome]